ncbi:MAG: hypothetical protein WC531_01975 [Candidatus Paceibacterota bacterium]|jgi:DNA-binding transcriptional regulator PaaX
MLGNLYLEENLSQASEKRKLEAQRERSLRVTLSKLKKKGLVGNDNHLWKLTAEGLRKMASYKMTKKQNRKQTENKNIRQMIIAFDIPEEKRKNRYWLRVELVSLGFKMLQKSVWLGPAPLPKELLDHLKNIDILPYLKFFEVKKSDIV